MSEVDQPGAGLYIMAPIAPKLTISGQVIIDLKDGSIEFMPGYEPTQAARQFWEAVCHNFRVAQIDLFKEVTPEMEEAGAAIIEDKWGHATTSHIVYEVWQAMLEKAKARYHPPKGQSSGPC